MDFEKGESLIHSILESSRIRTSKADLVYRDKSDGYRLIATFNKVTMMRVGLLMENVISRDVILGNGAITGLYISSQISSYGENNVIFLCSNKRTSKRKMHSVQIC